uniref:CEP170 C-terminal domain-containing protein n=1 Tax=Electrophorus electricus TaxID=8005 RepID=A0A4W4EK72_ELEEL
MGFKDHCLYLDFKTCACFMLSQHEKFSSQLQLTVKASSTVKSTRNSETTAAESGKEGMVKPPKQLPKQEDKIGDIGVVPRGTPLYGQPSWWGDVDDENAAKHDAKTLDLPGTMAQNSTVQEPSYFEIPSKEAISAGMGINDSLPTTEEGATVTSTAPVPEGSTHGHASFTIDFDTVAASRGKDRSTKDDQDHHVRPKRGAGEELSALQSAMIAAEVKVADWLAQNELPLALSESVAEDDGDSVKSDVPVQLRNLRGSKHEDGTQSDSENAFSEQLSSRRAIIPDIGRTGVHKTEGNFCRKEDHFQNKPFVTLKKMPPVGGEVGQRRNYPSPCRSRAIPSQRGNDRTRESSHRSQADDQSDRGTYTIELENCNTEKEKARLMIDKVLPDDLVVVGGPRWVSQWASLAASHIRTDPEGSGAESTMFATDEKGLHFRIYVIVCIFLKMCKNNQLHEMCRTRQRVARVNASTGGTRVNKQTTTKGHERGHNICQQIPYTRTGSGEKNHENESGKSRREEKEKSAKPLLRQESFTVERSNANIPLELIPCIDDPHTTSQGKQIGSINEDILLKDSEAVTVFLENTLSDLADPASYSLEGSVSPESDIDTTSTVSQAGGEVGCKKKVSRPIHGTANKNTSDTKLRSHTCAPTHSQSRAWTSLDLTDDDLNASLKDPQPRCWGQTRLRTETSSRTKGAKTRTAAAAFSSSRPASLPQPRPTRASLLRRARLGDSTDPDLADIDRVSVASEASTASSASRPSANRRTLSRIEALAQPRKPRVSSPSARSDSEATSRRTRVLVSRPGSDSALRLGLQSTAVSGLRGRTNSTSKLPDKSAGNLYVHKTPTGK